MYNLGTCIKSCFLLRILNSCCDLYSVQSLQLFLANSIYPFFASNDDIHTTTLATIVQTEPAEKMGFDRQGMNYLVCQRLLSIPFDPSVLGRLGSGGFPHDR